MTSLDPRSIAYSTVLVAALLFVVVLVYWKVRRTYAGFGWWVASIGLFAVTMTTLVVRDVLPTPSLSVPLVGLFSVLSVGAIAIGARNFFGRDARDPYVWALGLGGATAIVAIAATDLPNAFVTACSATIVALMLFRAAWIFFEEPMPHVRTAARICAAVLVGFGLTRLWRAGFILTAPSDHDVLVSAPAALFNYTMNLVFTTLWSFSFVFLNSARVEAELLGSRVEVERLVGTDLLTGVANRTAFFEAGAKWFERARRGRMPLSVIVIGVDHLRQVNTRHGHSTGDAVIADVAHELAALSPPSDVVARISGEEFAVLLPESTPEHAADVAQRYCIQVASRAVSPAHLSITASLGVATLQPEDPDFERLFRRAEHGLAQAKAAGRNRVVVG